MIRFRLKKSVSFYNKHFNANSIFIQCDDDTIKNQFMKDMVSKTYKKNLQEHYIFGYFQCDKDIRYRWLKKDILELLN